MRFQRLLMIVALTGASEAVYAGTVLGTGGATEVTQIMNNSELIAQTTNTLTMVEQGIEHVNNLRRNAQRFMNNPLGLGELVGVYRQVLSEVNRAQSLAYGVTNAVQSFKALHPTFDQAGTYNPAAYAIRSRAVMQSIQNAFEAGTATVARAQNEDQRIAAIGQLVNTADGQTQALQTANTIQYEVLQQLRDTKLYMQRVNEAQTAFMGHSVKNMDETQRNGDDAYMRLRRNRIVD